MTISYGLNVYVEGSIKMRTGYATTCTRWRKIIPIIFNKSSFQQTLSAKHGVKITELSDT